MKVAIHQPEYLGYLGFYNKMMNADVWVFLDNVQLAKRDFVRRNRIMGQGSPLWLSIPVITKDRYYQLIQDVEIDPTQGWRKSHWKSIQQVYAKAPFFSEYSSYLSPIYEREWARLADVNIAIIKTMAKLLGLDRQFYLASELNVEGKSSQLLADLTRAVGGDTYLSGPMGRDYIDQSIFDERRLEVEFNDFVHPTYPQKSQEFVPYLATIDLVFNCGPAAKEVIASGTANQNGNKEGFSIEQHE
jgi:hypothetical protein